MYEGRNELIIVSYLAGCGERARINFIHGAPTEYIANPTKALVELLQKRCTLAVATSKTMVARVIRDLEANGALVCMRDGRGGISKLKVVKLELPKLETSNVVAELPKTTPATLPVAAPIVSAVATPMFLERKKKIKRPHISKRNQRKRKEKADRGDRNEQRFRVLVGDLLLQLKLMSKGLYVGKFDQSGRHNPKKGVYDQRDHEGEDISISFPPPKPTRLIYDVKSSFPAARRFNKKIIWFSDQRDAKIKKAIAVNPHRSDTEIVREVLQDIRTAGLDVTPYEEMINKYFLITGHF